jgi:hypothetical protein
MQRLRNRKAYHRRPPEKHSLFLAKKKTNPAWRIAKRHRGRIQALCKKAMMVKKGRSMDLVGCTTAELVKHIECQFSHGMTWQNYGTVWHIDHIRPLASFNLLEESEQRVAFNFANLQPLFALENQMKGDSWNGG